VALQAPPAEVQHVEQAERIDPEPLLWEAIAENDAAVEASAIGVEPVSEPSGVSEQVVESNVLSRDTPALPEPTIAENDAAVEASAICAEPALESSGVSEQAVESSIPSWDTSPLPEPMIAESDAAAETGAICAEPASESIGAPTEAPPALAPSADFHAAGPEEISSGAAKPSVAMTPFEAHHAELQESAAIDLLPQGGEHSWRTRLLAVTTLFLFMSLVVVGFQFLRARTEVKETAPAGVPNAAASQQGSLPVEAADSNTQPMAVAVEVDPGHSRLGNSSDDTPPVSNQTQRQAASKPEVRPTPQRQPAQSPAVQNPALPRSDKRPTWGMALQRPRATKPPVASVREPAIAEGIAPPVISIDPRDISISAKPPELPRLAQPSTGYQPPELVHRVEPAYSDFARLTRIQGAVQVSATIDKEGVPRSLSRVSGNPGLAQLALEAIRQWRYKPAMINGQPVEAETVITITFQRN
jgi:TonB family protein